MFKYIKICLNISKYVQIYQNLSKMKKPLQQFFLTIKPDNKNKLLGPTRQSSWSIMFKYIKICLNISKYVQIYQNLSKMKKPLQQFFLTIKPDNKNKLLGPTRQSSWSKTITLQIEQKT